MVGQDPAQFRAIRFVTNKKTSPLPNHSHRGYNHHANHSSCQTANSRSEKKEGRARCLPFRGAVCAFIGAFFSGRPMSPESSVAITFSRANRSRIISKTASWPNLTSTVVHLARSGWFWGADISSTLGDISSVRPSGFAFRASGTNTIRRGAMSKGLHAAFSGWRGCTFRKALREGLGWCEFR